MVKRISKKYIKGIGSVIDIHPQKSYAIKSYLPDQTSADRLRGDWVRVGKSMSKAINVTTNGQK